MRNYIIHAWSFVDPIYDKIRNFSTIETEDNVSVFRVQLIRYRGENQLLSDGNLIEKGDYLVKIHLHNVKLLKYLQAFHHTRKTIKLYQIVKKALPQLALFIKNHPLSKQIKAICGVTMLTKLVERLGFEVRPISNKIYRLSKCFSQFPIHYLSTGTFRGLLEKRVNYLFMSKNKLFEFS
ncbi:MULTISPECIES: YkoP family protein [Bacillaceae]|uniref:YkoP-like domain-containing protein n=1 Tax=Evansella alkalicola TaxID=745819 RepID=A0ABS6JVN1_9BACI|nr:MULTISPECIES: hypothetical protein [Bacillaceae]MBU9722614.1 hypothetical protein [Bacillus alkalicola]